MPLSPKNQTHKALQSPYKIDSHSLGPVPLFLFPPASPAPFYLIQGLWFGFKGVGFGGGGLGVTLYLPVTQSITIAGPGSPVSLSQ